MRRQLYPFWRASLAAAVASGAMACTEAPNTALQSPLGVVYATIETPDPSVSLYRRLGKDERLVCRAPCNETVDARGGGELFLARGSARFSSEATFDDKRGQATLTVKSLPNTDLRVGGTMLTIASSIGLVAGLWMTALGYISEGSMRDFFVPGVIVSSASAALLPAGIVMLKFGRGRYDLNVTPMFVVPPFSPTALPARLRQGASAVSAAPSEARQGGARRDQAMDALAVRPQAPGHAL